MSVAHGTYTFTDRTYENLARAGILPVAVLEVLHRRPNVRRHIGSSLQVGGQDRNGTWLVVALVEGTDDEYVVTGARYLDVGEIEMIIRIIGREKR